MCLWLWSLAKITFYGHASQCMCYLRVIHVPQVSHPIIKVGSFSLSEYSLGMSNIKFHHYPTLIKLLFPEFLERSRDSISEIH